MQQRRKVLICHSPLTLLPLPSLSHLFRQKKDAAWLFLVKSLFLNDDGICCLLWLLHMSCSLSSSLDSYLIHSMRGSLHIGAKTEAVTRYETESIGWGLARLQQPK